MYTPSAEAEAIRRRLTHRAPSDPESVPKIPGLCLRFGRHDVVLRIGDEVLRRAIEVRFNISEPRTLSSAIELTALDDPTEDSDFRLTTPFRTLLARRKEMVYFGVQDKESFRVLAGSLGTGATGSTMDSSLSETDLLQCLIENEIIATLGRIVPELDFVHAATVARNGRAILLVGASRSGKSTLTAAAVLQGFQMLGDDIACVDLTRRIAYSYPRRRRLRAEGAAMLARLGPMPEHVLSEQTPIIGAICFLTGFAGQPALTPLTGSGAVWRMAKHTFHGERPAGLLTARLARQLPGLRCFELAVGDLERTAALLSATFAETATEIQ